MQTIEELAGVGMTLLSENVNRVVLESGANSIMEPVGFLEGAGSVRILLLPCLLFNEFEIVEIDNCNLGSVTGSHHNPPPPISDLVDKAGKVLFGIGCADLFLFDI